MTSLEGKDPTSTKTVVETRPYGPPTDSLPNHLGVEYHGAKLTALCPGIERLLCVSVVARRRLLEPSGSLPVVQSIVRLAHGMHLAVVAEGVETEAELDLVRVLGCDKVQGHVYGPAVGPDEAGELLTRNAVLDLVSRP